MKKVMFVAHPDDETIFGAGIILRYPGSWTIICCCTPTKGPERATSEFFKACKVLGATGILIPNISDFGLDVPLNGIEPYLKLLDDADIVVTHNFLGEYGHLHHRQVNKLVVDYCGKKTITFGYAEDPTIISPDIVINLSAPEIELKNKAINQYEHPAVKMSSRPYHVVIRKWMTTLSNYTIGKETYLNKNNLKIE